ncbi:MAG: hypothetical protein OXH11_04895 [Candidatus Aminicenantes bacterium]|nr:hypothetical protein [Candidatus Aminicenantes bacterium]
MKHLVGRIFVLAATLLCACDGGLQTPMSEAGPRSGPGEDRAQLGRMRSAFIRAMNEGGVEEWIRSHLDAGVAVMPPEQPTISSRQEVAVWARRFLQEHRIHDFAFTGSKTVTGDWAFENGVYLLESSPSAGGEKQSRRGKAIFIWRRGTDGWKGTLVSFNFDGYWP